MPDAPVFSIRSRRKWRFLWLKAVTGVDLDQHCARALKGPYHRAINTWAGAVMGGDCLTPDGVRAWYLCGVSTPYKWEENFHAAWTYAPGMVYDLVAHGITLQIDDAAPIRFDETSIPADDPHRRDRVYRTCRNYQFAHAIANTEPIYPAKQPPLFG